MIVEYAIGLLCRLLTLAMVLLGVERTPARRFLIIALRGRGGRAGLVAIAAGLEVELFII